MAVRRPPGPAPTTMARFLVDDGLPVALEDGGGGAAVAAASAAAAASATARLKGLKDTIVVQLLEYRVDRAMKCSSCTFNW